MFLNTKEQTLGSMISFHKGMSNHPTLVMKKILNTDNGPFEGLKELVDVGGGVGANLRLVLSKYPHIKGINYDLKHAIDTAPPLPGKIKFINSPICHFNFCRADYI